MKTRNLTSLLAGGVILASSAAYAGSMLGDVSHYGSLRPRIEMVDIDGGLSATAFTNQTTIGLKLKNINGHDGWSGVIEARKTTALIDDYNSTSAIGGNVNSDKAAVIDPPISRFTQAYIQYQANQLRVRFGEQILTRSDHRFIGHVGWRQTLQTFGALDVKYTFSDDFDVNVAWLYRRNGIKDEFSKTYETGSILLDTNYQLSNQVTLAGFAYLLEDVHNTLGVQVKGKVDKFSYLAEYAIQSDPSIEDNFSGEVDSDFIRLGMKSMHMPVTLGVSYTSLGKAKGDAATGFSTPLATLHKFEGWSDALLGKSANGDANGLQDIAISGEYTQEGLGKFKVAFHKFDSVSDSLDYGSELNASFSRPLSPSISVMLKGALYDGGDDFGTSTTKVWAMSTIKF